MATPNIIIGGNSIETASKEQLEATIKVAQDRLTELNKPKQYVFGEGDFAYKATGDGCYIASHNHTHDWCCSFAFLAKHCLKLGGRVMSKPNDGKEWYAPYYDYHRKKFERMGNTDYVGRLFNLQSHETYDQFLSTEGVIDHLYNFFQIEK